ncbi:MAG: type II toxin-antitoxin system VapC family toxin [Candidatus Aenigmarchaeota archaeon]|nr:type II toxin-antitoxin system VapC family toxin [Candidatus Aenigmarchaeota archaeon]
MIFLDTSLIIAYKIDNDQNHETALKIMAKISEGHFGNTVISDYIFDESLTVALAKTRELKAAVEIGEELMTIQIIKIDNAIIHEAWQIFKSQKGTKFSFTDCTCMALMEKFNIRNIATFDSDFKKIKEINVVQ